jgi:AAA domain
VTLRDLHDELADHDLEHNFGDISISNIGAGVSAEDIPPARRTHEEATVVIPMFPEDVGASESWQDCGNGQTSGDGIVRDGYIVAEIDWPQFWEQDLTARDFILEPVAPRGRAVTIVSKAKEGKSELALFCAVARAQGLKTLAQPAREPIDVLYVDHEMTDTDVQERLTDMGIDETVDLTHLHYVIMPGVAKLDTEAGGKALVSHVELTTAEVVFIDTLSKVIEGDENDAATWNAYWEHTGQHLHARGVTVIGLDHSGHSSTRARGSSAKQAIFDVIWELTRKTDGVSLKATHRRVSWVPEQVAFARKDDPVEYQANNPTLWPTGVEDAAAKLDDAGVPISGPDATERKAKDRLREAGYSGPNGIRSTLLRAALRWRRHPGTHAGTHPPDESGTHRGTH